MKIEKVNDHQIRCTLTREDLVSRELKISELAYGTSKAKDLFREMMQQAALEFDFDAEDIPLPPICFRRKRFVLRILCRPPGSAGLKTCFLRWNFLQIDRFLQLP